MAYTKYSLTPANNNATPPDGAPEGMLPSAVNDTMRDMMAQIRDVGDGIRGGTYTMTAPVITGGTITGVAFTGNTFTNPVISGGSINNTPIGASTANTGAFTTLSATGATTFSGATVVSGSLTANTFSSSGATITGGSITGITDLAVADGGTGASTAANARINLLAVGYTATTGSAIIPNGTTAQRDGSPAAGYFRYNSTVGKFEGYNGTAWGSVGGGATGGGGDEVFVENSTTVTTSYTLSTNKNAMSVGAITINSGATVTVPSGARWVVL
jgi:hypothetical protein